MTSGAQRAQLATIIEQAIGSFGDKAVTVRDVAKVALPKAKLLCHAEMDEWVMDRIAPMISRRLRKYTVRDTAQDVPLLRGFEQLALPHRIAVPPLGTKDDEHPQTRWIVLHNATLAELRRNVAMRRELIAGSIAECELLEALVLQAERAGGDDSDSLAELLAVRRPPPRPSPEHRPSM